MYNQFKKLDALGITQTGKNLSTYPDLNNYDQIKSSSMIAIACFIEDSGNITFFPYQIIRI